MLAEVDTVAAADVERAIDEAKASPEPDGSSLETQLYADGGSSWRN